MQLRILIRGTTDLVRHRQTTSFFSPLSVPGFPHLHPNGDRDLVLRELQSPQLPNIGWIALCAEGIGP
jgi:hypothetical protein